VLFIFKEGPSISSGLSEPWSDDIMMTATTAMVAIVAVVLLGWWGIIDATADFPYRLEGWTHEHSICNAMIDTSPSSLESSSKTTMSNYKCRDASYMEYVRAELKNSPAGATKDILDAIFDLYQDLDNNRKPVVMRIDNERTVNIHPIAFCIPEEFILQSVPPKEKPFGRVIPGLSTTYYSLTEETEYRKDMSRSLFSLTYKKGGWDCLRHVEILAAGSVPLFLDIDQCPPQSLAFYPKRLFGAVLKLPGLDLQYARKDRMTMAMQRMEMNLDKLNKKLYMATVAALLQYAKNVASTKAVAAYVLNVIARNQESMNLTSSSVRTRLPSSILYITHQDKDMDKGDYMTDMLLHGLKSLLGVGAVTDFPRRDGLYKTVREFNETSEYNPRRQKLYGLGFSWGLSLDDWEVSAVGTQSMERSGEIIQRKISEKAYDLVILGSGHRDGWASKLFYWDLVCKYYPPAQVAWVDGADSHLGTRLVDKYSRCAGHLFSREGPQANLLVS
jgi:hypothetical protein